jgi:hypothetical protein
MASRNYATSAERERGSESRRRERREVKEPTVDGRGMVPSPVVC